MNKKETAQFLGLAGALVAAMLLVRKKVGTVTAAAITIAVLDESGNEIPHNSPVDLEAGGLYTVGITVTNQSTLQGTPVAVNLTSSIGAMIVGLPPLISDTRTDAYSPGQSKTFTYPMQLPNYACDGEIRAIIFDLPLTDPNHHQLALATLEFNVIEAPPATASISGSVRGLWQSGPVGVAGATIAIGSATEIVATGTTDSDGLYSIIIPMPSQTKNYNVAISHLDYFPISVSYTFTAGQNQVHNLSLVPNTANLSGQVVNINTLAPIASVRVEVVGLIYVYTDTNGEYSILGIPIWTYYSMKYTVRFSHPDYETVTYSNVQFDGGAMTVCNVELTPLVAPQIVYAASVDVTI